MENFSEDELTFIRNGVANGIRMDLRKVQEERSAVHVGSYVAQSDGHIRLKRGLTELEVFMQFKETSETLSALSLIDKEHELDEPAIESSFPLPNTVKNMILEFLSPYKLGMRIDFSVVNDDGNVYDLFFLGLSAIFRNIEVPVLENLQNVDKTTLDLPISRTFALFGKTLIIDPTKIEEEASHGLMRILSTSEKGICGCFLEKNCKLEHNVLIDVLQVVEGMYHVKAVE